ncbi:hypothetical protein H6G00_22185 [Leptolyngbya sp. FACHB-541]|uniref:hypothetical protein n=1 Tax=Leptolyngbya sp. FACHB-541 TaxID=2692810 RepID=UPI0016868AC2|nr:hypothetical protein [Leptolyngbya sp. FACHB-541]MBD1999287.1 hypothetical protein [Leptolyngbya sp. FACHB-541]
MKELPPLDGLSLAQKDALIGGLWQELQTLRSEVEKLRQTRVKKTSRNSSLPPSQGFKPNRSSAGSTPLNGEETGYHGRSGRELS